MTGSTILLSELVDIYLGLTHTPEYVLSGVPFLSVKNISSGNIDFSQCNYITEEEYNELPKGAKPQIGDMLFCRVGTIGKPVIIEPNTPKFGSFVSLGFFRLKDNSLCKLKYLYYWMYSESFYSQVQRNVKGASQVNLNTGWLSKFEVPLYSLEEQENLILNLEKVDALIVLRKQQLEKLDELIKARFVELFGDPFNNKKWDTQKLRNISVSISDGSNVDKAYYEDKGDVLFLRIQNVWFNEFRLDDSVYISEDVNNEYLDTSLHHGDLLITKIGRYYTKDSSLGRVSVYLGEDDKANYSNNIMRVRLTDEVCSEFVNILMNLDDYNRYIREVSVGGTDKRALSKAIIGDLPIIMPPKELQVEFLEFVRQTDKSKLAVQQSLAQLETLKKALMQQYFG